MQRERDLTIRVSWTQRAVDDGDGGGGGRHSSGRQQQ